MTYKEKLKDIVKLADAMYYAAQYLTTDASMLHKAMDEYHKFIIHEWREEPVNYELEEAATKYAQDKYMPVQTSQAFKAGAKWQKTHLWKPADGDDLPIFDREVIALEGIVVPTATDCFCGYKVVFAHRPTLEGYEGKSIATGVVEHYTPKTYGEGGWNIPNIVYWLDVKLPKEIEL